MLTVCVALAIISSLFSSWSSASFLSRSWRLFLSFSASCSCCLSKSNKHRCDQGTGMSQRIHVYSLLHNTVECSLPTLIVYLVDAIDVSGIFLQQLRLLLFCDAAVVYQGSKCFSVSVLPVFYLIICSFLLQHEALSHLSSLSQPLL